MKPPDVTSLQDKYLAELSRNRGVAMQRLLARLDTAEADNARLREELSSQKDAHTALMAEHDALRAQQEMLDRQLDECQTDFLWQQRNLDALRQQLRQQSLIVHREAALDATIMALEKRATSVEGMLAACLDGKLTRYRRRLLLQGALPLPITIQRWLVAPGQYIGPGQLLCETDKGALKLASPSVLEKICRGENQTVDSATDEIAVVLEISAG